MAKTPIDWESEALITGRQRDKALATLATCRYALKECAAALVLKAPEETEINYERVMREVYRRMAIAKEALEA